MTLKQSNIKRKLNYLLKSQVSATTNSDYVTEHCIFHITMATQ